MNLGTFKAHKQGIKENLKANLIWDKHHNNMDREDSLIYDRKVIEVLYDEEPRAVQDKLLAISNYINKGYEVRIEEMTKHQYRTTYSIGTKYTILIPKLADFIGDRHVESKMRDFIKLQIGKDLGYNIYTVRCEVLELFNQERISWDDVLIAHTVDCSF